MDSEQITKEEISKKHKISPSVRRYIDMLVLSLCALLIGAVTGVIVAVFGRVLIEITQFRTDNTYWLLPFLALAGFLIILIYDKLGRETQKGMSLLFEKAQNKRDKIPLRLIPFVTLSTWLTHLFGGSAGREGVAVQIGGTIGSFVSEKIKIENSGKILMIAGMAAGFGGLFRTPVAATFFAVEVLAAGVLEITALLPALIGAFTASTVSGLLGLEKFIAVPEMNFEVNIQFIMLICVIGVIFGITGGLFAYLLGKAKTFFAKIIKNPYLRIVIIGAVLSVVLLLLWNGRYCGLGTNLISASFSGNEIYPFDFAFKFILTIITLAAGFQGGEVTPLFAIGSSLGILLGTLFNMPVMLCAALGYIAVFGAATNTFIAPIFIGAEVFGYQYLPYYFIVCILAYIFNGNNCIYSLQIRK